MNIDKTGAHKAAKVTLKATLMSVHQDENNFFAVGANRRRSAPSLGSPPTPAPTSAQSPSSAPPAIRIRLKRKRAFVTKWEAKKQEEEDAKEKAAAAAVLAVQQPAVLRIQSCFRRWQQRGAILALLPLAAVYQSRKQSAAAEETEEAAATRMQKNIMAVPDHFYNKNNHEKCGDKCPAKSANKEIYDAAHVPHATGKYLDPGQGDRHYNHVVSVFKTYSSPDIARKLTLACSTNTVEC